VAFPVVPAAGCENKVSLTKDKVFERAVACGKFEGLGYVFHLLSLSTFFIP